MSLLIKALEQAAKDREAASKAEIPRGAEPATANVSALADAGGQRRASSSLSGLSQIEAQQRARAAAVVQAGERRSVQMIDYLRRSPVAMVGAIAVVVGIAFGIYVYIQLANPGLLARSPPPLPPQAPPPAQSAAATEPSAPPPAPLSAPAPAPAIASLPETPAVAPPASTPTSAGAISTTPAAPTGTAKPLSPPGANAPIATAAIIGTPGAPQPPRAAASSPETREAPSEARREPKPAPAAAPPATSAARERIVVSAGSPKPTMNPMLGPAYAALQSGDTEQARDLYRRIGDAEPLNIDALLGLAFIAVQENRSDDAMKDYVRILQLEPRNTVAQAGMIALVGRADPIAAETRLKQLISREPSSFLHFILGNLYADQSAWSQAQQSYFQAYHLDPDNADYAYNLAVSLDHLRQSKLALEYYQRAGQLAESRGRANFNVSQARERVRSLSSQIQ